MSTPQTQMTGPRTVVVTITPAAAASPDPVTISRENEDQVKWVGPPGFVVDFGNETPFDRNSFDGDHPQSGKAKGHAPLKQYKYTVKVPGQPDNDPGLILQGGGGPS